MFVNEARLGDAAEVLRTGQVEASSYLDACRDRFVDVEPDVEAFLPEEERWNRLETRVDALETQFDAPVDRPPLYGVPVGVKDIFNVDGFPTRAGSDVPAAAFAGPEATAWTRLADAGAVPLGKTVTTEFAYFAPGPTRNPHDLDRTPGGSSSGSAAAVAAGLCPLALGTQTIGSVIRPAAFCGVVGVKPSYGRVPLDGVVPVSSSLDHVGWFTQDIAGAELAAAVLCDDWDTIPDPGFRPTLGVPDDAYLDQADDEGREAFERHLDALAEAGYDIVQTDALSSIEAVNDRHERLMAGEMALAHRERGWYPDHADSYHPETLELVEEGDEVGVPELAAGRTGRIDLRERLHDAMDEHGIDVWVSPAAPGPAPEGIDDTGDPAMNLPWTHSGLPTVSLPVDETEDGLPLGLQCSARFGGDEELLGWSRHVADDLGLLTA